MSARLARLARWETALAACLAAVLLYGFFAVPGFWSSSNMSLALQASMPTAIVCLGLALVLMTGQIDISVASVLALSSTLLGKLYGSGAPLWLAIAAALAAGVAAGSLNGLLIARFGLPSLVVTLGTLALFRGICFIVLGDQQVSAWPSGFTSLSSGSVAGGFLTWSVVLFAVLLALLALVFEATWVGRTIQAIGRSADASRFAGIRVGRVTFAVFVLSGLLAAVAGVVETARLSSASPANGTGLELDVIAIVLLGGISIFGGRGTLAGVVLSLGLVIALRNVLGLEGVGGDVQQVVIGALLVGSVLVTNVAAGARRARVRPLPPPPAQAAG
ncbi:ABC transporter permease [Conexibacter sp. CPCC 206217]|uniref:ABC transporter permease n=1 Tax=Conexibacter sp. CPCC 206217 TaxID=3064574 RepID=UPI002722920C|nr:ABC transporter permease [Conexibacter sp. CPCC 206217]MDO8208776.1 ABC transporter permease [Conexibacter sp. CPCC 206217]